MKQAKIVKLKASDLFEAADKTMEYLGIDKRKVEQQALQGFQSALFEKPVPFHCRRCSTRFQPKPHQWIFYDLCDTCFAAFDGVALQISNRL